MYICIYVYAKELYNIGALILELMCYESWNGCPIAHTTATHCNTLQHTATHCHTLQYAATYCSSLQHIIHTR